MEYFRSLTKEFILDIFDKTGGMLTGHFKLSSGNHSDVYLQCARVLQFPEICSLLSSMIAKKFKDEKINAVIGPAIGGITLSYEVAAKLHCRSIFAERVQVNDKKIMSLRRGFEILPDERVLVVEDVVTTGGSTREVMELVKKCKGRIAGVAAIVDRTNGKIKLHPNQSFLMNVDAKKFSPDNCPLCKKKIPLEAPGSKYL